jgi:hypothetical protein
MGTQQLLLLALGVIIVGVAIAVGITMFNNQAYKANEQAVVGDLSNLGTQVIQFWKTPIGQGGASHLTAEVTENHVAKFLGFDGTGNTLNAPDGIFRVADIIIAPDTLNVILEGIGDTPKGTYYPFVTTTVDLKRSIITNSVGRKEGGGF